VKFLEGTDFGTVEIVRLEFIVLFVVLC